LRLTTVANLKRPTPTDIEHTPAEFPETATVAALAETMVEIDKRWESSADWKTSSARPDIDPAHEALLLVEHFREAARLSERRPLQKEFAEIEANGKDLERLLRAATDKARVEVAFRKVDNACARCHAEHRDVRRK
jgi:hypothetical protein